VLIASLFSFLLLFTCSSSLLSHILSPFFPSVLVAFHHCDKIPEKINLFGLTVSEVSVHWHVAVLGLWQYNISRQEHVTEEDCSAHGGQEAKRETKRAMVPNIPF
jgi:hypothetical protein